VEESLKNLMQDLGNAINDSLSESDRIAEAIGEIKRAGFDVFLVLEATIGFNKRDEPDTVAAEEVDSEEEAEEVASTTSSTGGMRFTPQDQRFLKALKILSDE
jgi:hypothetical protein